MAIVLYRELNTDAAVPTETGFHAWIWREVGAHKLLWHATSIYADSGEHHLPVFSHSQSLARQLLNVHYRSKAANVPTTMYLRVTGEPPLDGLLYPEVICLDSVMTAATVVGASGTVFRELQEWLKTHERITPICQRLTHHPPEQRGHKII